jgi:DNA-binding NtrC family response regulator
VFVNPPCRGAATLLATLGPSVVGLVVSDIRMPRMNGLELAALVRQRWPTVPLILVSGQGGPPADYSGPFFAKPLTLDTLVAAVGDILPVAEAQPVSAKG